MYVFEPKNIHFWTQVHEKRLEAAREEERMLEAKRQFEEEQGPGADKAQIKSSKAAIGATAKDQVCTICIVRLFLVSLCLSFVLCLCPFVCLSVSLSPLPSLSRVYAHSFTGFCPDLVDVVFDMFSFHLLESHFAFCFFS